VNQHFHFPVARPDLRTGQEREARQAAAGQRRSAALHGPCHELYRRRIRIIVARRSAQGVERPGTSIMAQRQAVASMDPVPGPLP
jgi:uncharacterized DUF497 family protein